MSSEETMPFLLGTFLLDGVGSFHFEIALQ
jgi:hypothetical protein